MSGFRALLWDKDGTLLDTFAFWVELERRLARLVAGRFLVDADAYTDRVLTALGVVDGRVSAHGILAGGTETDILGAFFNALGTRRPARREFDAEIGRQLPPLLREPVPPQPFDGIRETLGWARASGIAQGVATADTGASVTRDLRLSGLDAYFGFVASSDSPGVKPDAWPVTAFAGWAGVAASEVLVVGDTPVDQAMAAHGGAGFVGALWGTGRPEDFAAASTAITPRELRRFFGPT